MTQVVIKFAPQHVMMEMYRPTALVAVTKALLERTYTNSDAFEVDATGMAAAEEAFDLTNNPSREDERERVYGRGRSLSVGDIVVVGEEMFLCKSMGWQRI